MPRINESFEKFVSSIYFDKKINVLAMEYSGYSIHKGKPNSDTIKDDAIIVYNFVK